MTDYEHRLQAHGLELPAAAAPVALYVPFYITGSQLYVSGQLCQGPEGLVKGRLGETLSIEEGQKAARLCALHLLAQIKAACGLERLQRVVKLGGFINVHPDFTDIPLVMNGCSQVMIDVFGEAGRHARSAVGCSGLPLGAAVEVDGIFEITP